MERNRIENLIVVETGLEEEYENCLFENCNFAEAKLNGIVFSNCEFLRCDFSMAQVKQTSFRDVLFNECKMLGLRMDECDRLLLAFSFQHCILNFCSFFKLNLKKTAFKSCSIQEVDFTGADLSHSVFDASDLLRATFDQTNLEGSDFRTAFNYSIDPEKNRLKKAHFSKDGIQGLLDKYNLIIE